MTRLRKRVCAWYSMVHYGTLQFIATTQIFELDSFKVTHASKYPSPVLSLGISPDCKLLAVGMADGTLSIRQHDRPRVTLPDGTLGPPSSSTGSTGKLGRRVRLNASNFRYFIRGQNVKASVHEHKVVAKRKAKLKPYDKLLRQFKWVVFSVFICFCLQFLSVCTKRVLNALIVSSLVMLCRYRDALNAALQTRKAEIVVTVVEELAARDGLDNALGGRDAATLEPLLQFLSKYIVEPRYGKTVCNLTHRILDIYTGVVSLDYYCMIGHTPS
jgi:U3 small nucleolar RNA-associated protein 15